MRNGWIKRKRNGERVKNVKIVEGGREKKNGRWRNKKRNYGKREKVKGG